MIGVNKEFLRSRLKHKEFNFSCKQCAKYVAKPFNRHWIWHLALLGTKSHGAREKFTNLYMVHR